MEYLARTRHGVKLTRTCPTGLNGGIQMDHTWKFDLQLFAEDPNAGGDNGGGTDPDGKGDNAGNDDGNKGDNKTFTQAELDAILSKRLARERKQWEQQVEDAKKKAAMDETERLKAEKAEAEQKAQAAQAAANQRLIKAEAKVQAAALGVKPERIDYAIRLADLSGVEVGDDGEPDAKAVKAAIEAVLRDVPELKGVSGSVGTGSNPGGDGNQGTKNPWKRETFNLTEQARLLRENPALAAQLKAAAGG